MKVRIILTEDIGDKEIADLVKTAGITNINEARVKRFGILTGEVSPLIIDTIKSLPGVNSVEIDGVVSLIQ